MRLPTAPATIAAAIALTNAVQPQPALASARPVCSGERITRAGTLRSIENPENGGVTRFVSRGGGMYGVDPNSIPEQIADVLRPNGPAVRVMITGRTCQDHIFYIERALEPVATPLRPYTP